MKIAKIIKKITKGIANISISSNNTTTYIEKNGKVTITINGKKIDPESEEGKAAKKKIDKKIENQDRAFGKMDKAFEKMEEAFDKIGEAFDEL